MSILEIRRHSHRKSGAGSQLSQAGVDLARTLGITSGPYAEVITSVLPRARETAIAMGFAVDRELVTTLTDEDVLAAIERAIAHDRASGRTDDTFSAWSRALAQPPAHEATSDQHLLHRWSHTIAGLWRDLMTPHCNSDARVLFIGHSGDLEAGLVSCLPQADHSSWGGAFGPLEGAELHFVGEPARFQRATLLRHSSV